MHCSDLIRFCYTSTILISEFSTFTWGVVLDDNLFAAGDDFQDMFSSSLDTADVTTSDFIGEDVMPSSLIDANLALGGLDAGVGEEDGLFDTDNRVLFAGGGSCSPSGGVERRDGSGHAQCPTSNNQLRIPTIPGWDDVVNSIGSGDMSKDEQPDRIDEVVPTEDLLSKNRQKCSMEHPYYLCCFCDMSFTWDFCWGCIASKQSSSPVWPIDFPSQSRLLPPLTNPDRIVSSPAMVQTGCFEPRLEVCCGIFGPYFDV